MLQVEAAGMSYEDFTYTFHGNNLCTISSTDLTQTNGISEYLYVRTKANEGVIVFKFSDPTLQSESLTLVFRDSVSGDSTEQTNTGMTQNGTLEMHLDITYPPNTRAGMGFLVHRTLMGLAGWEDSYSSGYSLILYNGDQNIYYGGHPSEYAEVRFTDFGLSGNEPLEGEFWEYASNGEFIRATPKFVLFPNFNNQVFRILIDQHWSEPENTGTLEGFSLRWNEDRPGSVINMDLFHPGGGPFPRPNGDPGDDRMFAEKGSPVGEIHGNWGEVKIDVSLSDYNLMGNEVLDGEFWELSELDGSEIANSGVFNIRLHEWTGIPSSAYVPETLEGLKLRISEVYYPDYVILLLIIWAAMDPLPIYTERIVTLGQYDQATQSGLVWLTGSVCRINTQNLAI